ncbi:hypothetical protein PR048_031778 [Dryococelus australis]|uniref:Uncharacterized protein n=1 Tax=Dryococelus australis TaxID=614101 RepID=A0ABQ9G682_9NEOP|nr:hypothetical protein PR048_031778 [Dryococelus australis]
MREVATSFPTNSRQKLLLSLPPTPDPQGLRHVPRTFPRRHRQDFRLVTFCTSSDAGLTPATEDLSIRVSVKGGVGLCWRKPIIVVSNDVTPYQNWFESRVQVLCADTPFWLEEKALYVKKEKIFEEEIAILISDDVRLRLKFRILDIKREAGSSGALRHVDMSKKTLTYSVRQCIDVSLKICSTCRGRHVVAEVDISMPKSTCRCRGQRYTMRNERSDERKGNLRLRVSSSEGCGWQSELFDQMPTGRVWLVSAATSGQPMVPGACQLLVNFLQGEGNGIPPEKPAHERHCPARFPLAGILERPGRGLNMFAFVGGEQANRSTTRSPLVACRSRITPPPQQIAGNLVKSNPFLPQDPIWNIPDHINPSARPLFPSNPSHDPPDSAANFNSLALPSTPEQRGQCLELYRTRETPRMNDLLRGHVVPVLWRDTPALSCYRDTGRNWATSSSDSADHKGNSCTSVASPVLTCCLWSRQQLSIAHHTWIVWNAWAVLMCSRGQQEIPISPRLNTYGILLDRNSETVFQSAGYRAPFVTAVSQLVSGEDMTYVRLLSEQKRTVRRKQNDNERRGCGYFVAHIHTFPGKWMYIREATPESCDSKASVHRISKKVKKSPRVEFYEGAVNMLNNNNNKHSSGGKSFAPMSRPDNECCSSWTVHLPISIKTYGR